MGPIMLNHSHGMYRDVGWIFSVTFSHEEADSDEFHLKELPRGFG